MHTRRVQKGLYQVLTSDYQHVANIVYDGINPSTPWRLKHLNGMLTPYEYRTVNHALAYATEWYTDKLISV